MTSASQGLFLRCLAVGGLAAACGCGPAALRIGREPVPGGEGRGRQEREDVFEFTQKPTVARDGTRWVITFASKGRCDATVAILDKDGKVVRHLGSGVLGANAPYPFQRGSLSQKLEWDGTDDTGKPAAPDCTVHVRLGMRPEFERLIPIEPPSFLTRGIAGLVVDSRGTLWVLQGITYVRSALAPEISAFDSQGRYLKTIVPFRADAPRDKLPHVRFREGSTGPEPVRETWNMLPGLQGVARQCLLLQGNSIIVTSGKAAPNAQGKEACRRLLKINLDGSTDKEFLGPEFPPRTWWSSRFYSTLGPDGETMYFAGFSSVRSKQESIDNVVWQAKWSDAVMKPFAGPVLGEGGNAVTLNTPRGLGVDHRGRLVVCDYQNDRLCLLTTEGKLVKTLAVRGPEQILVHPKTGAVYVLSIGDRDKITKYGDARWELKADKSVIKFKSTDDFTELARMKFSEQRVYVHDFGPILALDTTQDATHLWAACVGPQDSDGFLWRIRDSGDKLERVPLPLRRYYDPFGTEPWPGEMAADPATGDVYFLGRSTPTVLRIGGDSGEATRLDALAGDLYGGHDIPYLKAERKACGIAVGPEGTIYIKLTNTWGGKEAWIRRFDRKGQLVPFAAAGNELVVNKPSRGHHSSGLGVAANGDIYVIGLAADGKVRGGASEYNVLNVYDSDGKLKKAGAMPYLTCGAWGPRFDRRGRMYLTDSVRPLKQGDDMVGSLICLRGPESRWLFGENLSEASQYEMRRAEKNMVPVGLQGAEWVHYGVSPVPFGPCTCYAAPLDVDRFDRIAACDDENCKVKLLDSAGNMLLGFGQFANRDSLGPGSDLPVPEFPLASVNAVAIGADRITVYDRFNNRLLRVRLRYAAEEIVPLP